ncbi:hypothetical protein ACFSQJ_18795 [Croceitalea marina]|uniref:Uncharacterized protein n=2 Tax=Croceitalea marina TaxID=1775166 RepID=A0ABW5MZZ0_9FLAO
MILSLVYGCENPEDFNPSNLIDVMDIQVRNDNTPADGISRITVVASFDEEFSTEDDQKIDFVVFKDSLESSSQNLVFTSVNGIEQRISELFVVHNKQERLQVKATASVNGAQFSKTVDVNFENAYPEAINVFTDSLTINPNSFNQIKITTELSRSVGMVNSGIKAETHVVDTLGNTLGLFNNYQNTLFTRDSGRIENRFSLGNESYLGKLLIVAKTETPAGELRDTTIIFSKNN